MTNVALSHVVLVAHNKRLSVSDAFWFGLGEGCSTGVEHARSRTRQNNRNMHDRNVVKTPSHCGFSRDLLYSYMVAVSVKSV